MVSVASAHPGPVDEHGRHVDHASGAYHEHGFLHDWPAILITVIIIAAVAFWIHRRSVMRRIKSALPKSPVAAVEK